MPQKTKVAASGNRNKQNIAELKNILKTINSSLNPYDLAVNCLRMSQLMYGLESEREKFTNTYGTKVFQYHMAFIESLYNKVSVSPDILENEKILEFMRIDDFAITLKTVMDLEMAMDSKMENDLEMKNDFPITSPIMHTVISIFAKYEESHHDKLDKNVIKALEEILGPNEQRPDNLRAKETIAICAKIGSFTLAKQYIDCRKNENAQAILKGTAIAALINKGGEVGEQYIRSVLNILDVDIKDFQILGGRYSGARVVIETVCNLFESGSYESAKKILSYFVNIGLPINGNVFSSNAIIIITNMGENISLNTKVELITYLLNECGADLNTKVYDATDSNVVTNPVCNILGLGDKKLIEFVLRKGGDLLYFAPNEVIVINGSLSVEEEIKILHIIEEYMIEQIEKEIASVSVENVLEEEKESSSITSDETPIAKSEEEPESITVSSVDKCIEKYAAFKEWESKNSNISQEESLKSKIDLLVLKCIKDEVNREDYVNQIDELLSENPELHGYSVTAALHNNISQSDAGEIFARKQQLLHEFCMRRKELVNAERDPNEKAIDNVLGENIYKIHTSENFKNLCFFKLPENHCIEESKLLSVGFVGRSSTGENGIKLHKNGCTRLKVDGSDKAYYSNECLVDKDFENLIYIFGCFLNHEAGRYIINSHQPIEKHYISHEDFCSILSGQTEFHCEELSNF